VELELVKHVSFSEYNERLYYEKHKDNEIEIIRREFIKYLVVGSAGILIPITSPKIVNANLLDILIKIAKLIYYGVEIISGITHLSSNKKHSCNIELINKGNRSSSTPLTCYAYNKKKRKSSYYLTKQSKKIPANTFAEYTVKNLPGIKVLGKYRLGVKSSGNEMRKDVVIV
jgi:hypothetical protein